MARCGALGLLVVAVLGLSGCVAVSEEEARQLDQIGDVEIRTVVCASRPTAVQPCPIGNSGRMAGSGDYQLLVGYRIPRNSQPPESLGSDPEAGADLALMQSPSYGAELERLAPAGPSQRWVGYISPPFGYQSVGGDYRAALIARFALLRSADGAPAPSPFRFRTVVGWRTASPDVNRPVNCGEALEEQHDGQCMDWPSPEQLGEHVAVDTRDFGVQAGPLTRAGRGTTTAVPFTLRHAGGDGAPAFTMSASTNAPGATATPQEPTFAPAADSATPFLVSLALPSGTPPGTYDVTLAATLANGQQRAATARLRVERGDGRGGPALAIAVPPAVTLEDVLRSGLPVDAACSRRCRLDAQLRISRRDARRARIAARRTVRVGSGRARISSAGRGTVVLEVAPRARARLARLEALTATVRVRATGRDGRRTTRAKRIRLR